VLRDITDQRRIEAELREAQDELERRVVERTLSLARANRELNIEIEERRQAEVALKSSERQLRLMADSLPVVLAYVDARQRFVLSNATYHEWFVGESSDVSGKPVWDVVGIERYKVIRPFVEQAISGKQVVTEVEVNHKALGERHVQMNLVPDRDESGKVQGFYAIGLDITESKHAKVVERKHREELAHTARVNIMGELAAALAHELNQPLTSIRSNAQAALRLMGRGDMGLDDLEEILKDVIADNRRASEVIRRLRAMLRKRPITLETLSLKEVVEETLSMVRNDAILRGIALELRLADDLPNVKADRIQLQQVLLNLVVNGFDAMRDKEGEKLVTVRSSRTSSGDVCVCVSDLGPGLDAGADTDALFQPFFSTKAEGMGMGLSISRSIIEAMGGRIWAVNNEGPGATFHFTLPVAE
jgi:PAS domain S-box-containing protein